MFEIRKWLVCWILCTVLCFIQFGCDPPPVPNKNKVANSAQDRKSVKSESTVQLEQKLQEQVLVDVGAIMSSYQGKGKQVVLIFEETHISRIGQMEIALMLLRVHRHFGLKVVALEGAFLKDGDIDPNWFQQSCEDEDDRAEVALRLLEEGEISAAEFLSLTISGIRVAGIENHEEWVVEATDEDNAAPILCLYTIAQKLLENDSQASQKTIQEINALAQKVQALENEIPGASEAERKKKEQQREETLNEILERVIQSQQWTRNIYEAWKKEDSIRSIEQEITTMQTIEAKLRELQIDMTQFREHFANAKKFYEIRGKASSTMVSNTLYLAESHIQIIAMNAGAAHTEKVCQLLKQKQITHVVLRPLSLVQNQKIGDMSMDAFNRKIQGESIAVNGMLTTLLEGHKKPPSVLKREWFQADSRFRLACTLMLRDFQTSGGSFPSPRLKKELVRLGPDFKVDLTSIAVDQGEVIFKVQIGRPEKREFWARVAEDQQAKIALTSDEQRDQSLKSLQREMEYGMEAKTSVQRQNLQKALDQLPGMITLSEQQKQDVTRLRAVPKIGNEQSVLLKALAQQIASLRKEFLDRVIARLLARLKNARSNGIQQIAKEVSVVDKGNKAIKMPISIPSPGRMAAVARDRHSVSLAKLSG